MKKSIRDTIFVVAFLIIFTLIISLPMIVDTGSDNFFRTSAHQPQTEKIPTVRFGIPITFGSNAVDFALIGNIIVYKDEACTEIFDYGRLDTDLASYITVGFNNDPEAGELYIKMPDYYIGRNTESFTLPLSDGEDVFLERDGEPCFEVSNIRVWQGLPTVNVPSGGTMQIDFKPIGEQDWFPRSGCIYIDGEKYIAETSAVFLEDEGTIGNTLDSCSIIFEIPYNVTVDINSVELTFDSVCEIYDGFVVPYVPE